MRGFLLLLLPYFTVAVVGAPNGTQPWFSGMNVPWNHFGADIGANQFDLSWFESFFAGAASNGSNVGRFWLHADGNRGGIVYAGDGSVAGLTPSFLDDLSALAMSAVQHEIVLQLCLWSFDMCKSSEFPGQALRTDLITDEAKAISYVENALRPMLAALAPSSALPAGSVLVEVINEPEWCMKVDGGCTADACVEPAEMQRFVGMVAAVVRDAGLKVTVGSASLKWNAAGGSGTGNLWGDEALQVASGSATARLDHYQVHYYDWMYDPDWGYDPCRKPVSYWQLDKPVVVGELPANSMKYTTAAMMDCALSNGFAGDMFWAFNDPAFPIEPAADALRAFRSAHADIASYEALRSWLAKPTPAPAPPACVDIAPDAQYTCEQQAEWGKCDVKANPWMAGYCCMTCFKCDGICGK